MCYLKTTTFYSLHITHCSSLSFQGFTYAGWAGGVMIISRMVVTFCIQATFLFHRNLESNTMLLVIFLKPNTRLELMILLRFYASVLFCQTYGFLLLLLLYFGDTIKMLPICLRILFFIIKTRYFNNLIRLEPIKNMVIYIKFQQFYKCT